MATTDAWKVRRPRSRRGRLIRGRSDRRRWIRADCGRSPRPDRDRGPGARPCAARPRSGSTAAGGRLADPGTPDAASPGPVTGRFRGASTGRAANPTAGAGGCSRRSCRPGRSRAGRDVRSRACRRAGVGPGRGASSTPGAAGPGISQSGDENFLDGALDPRTGWPFVFLDHFQPRPERVERFWVVQTRDCPQEMGSDPWPQLKVLHFDAKGELAEHDPAELFAQAAGRVVLVQVQGSLTTPDIALGGLLWTHSWLERNKALARRRGRRSPSTGRASGSTGPTSATSTRRAAGPTSRPTTWRGSSWPSPPASRVCLLGQSYGGRVVPSALHLLGGGALNSQDHDPPVRLPGYRPDLHLRAVIIAGASDHDWLDPGQRLDRALHGCEAFLNLYNRKRRGAAALPVPDPERPPPGARQGRPDEPRLRPARPARRPLRRARRPRRPRHRALPARRRGQPPDRPPDRPLPLEPEPPARPGPGKRRAGGSRRTQGQPQGELKCAYESPRSSAVGPCFPPSRPASAAVTANAMHATNPAKPPTETNTQYV